MPYKNEYMVPEILLSTENLTVYYTYNNDDFDDRQFFHYCLSPDDVELSDDDRGVFDVRDLPEQILAHYPEINTLFPGTAAFIYAVRLAIREAIATNTLPVENLERFRR